MLEPTPCETTTPGAAFQAIALSCLHRFEINRELLATTGKPEALHQVRVALRQLRTAFAVFEEVLDDEQFGHLRQELRWLAAATNDARDLDALIARIDDVPAALAQARERACARTSKVLASARSERLIHDLIDWLANGAPREARGAAGETAASFASASLSKLRAKLKRQGRHLRTLDDGALHDVRITSKKLRYAAWFFTGLFPGGKAERRAKRFTDAMRTVQDRLGEIQDVAVAPSTLKRLRVPQACWPKLPDRTSLVNRAAEDLARALECKPYWR